MSPTVREKAVLLRSKTDQGTLFFYKAEGILFRVVIRADRIAAKLLLKSIHYRQFSIIIRSLDCSSTCGKSSHLPSLDTGSPPIHPPTDFSGTKTCRTFRVLRSKKSILLSR